ncbi:MAG TPA: hypothetical protein VFV92_13060, partial [Candidatus Bathyarchaeia archaeon]|nr:hypothetical protein [Candidatus Bathyarchaeia archaeon]
MELDPGPALMGKKRLTSIPNETLAFLRRLDLIILSASIVTFFLALASSPWWTLTGTTARDLLNI